VSTRISVLTLPPARNYVDTRYAPGILADRISADIGGWGPMQLRRWTSLRWLKSTQGLFCTAGPSAQPRSSSHVNGMDASSVTYNSRAFQKRARLSPKCHTCLCRPNCHGRASSSHRWMWRQSLAEKRVSPIRSVSPDSNSFGRAMRPLSLFDVLFSDYRRSAVDG